MPEHFDPPPPSLPIFFPKIAYFLSFLPRSETNFIPHTCIFCFIVSAIPSAPLAPIVSTSHLSFANIVSNMNTSKPQQLGSSNINCGNVSGSYNTWNNCDISVTDERRQILEWLSPLAPRKRHRDIRESQV